MWLGVAACLATAGVVLAWWRLRARRWKQMLQRMNWGIDDA